MYESLTKRLAGYESLALLGLYFAQYLLVLAAPALIILGFGIWNPFAVLAGLMALRLLFLCCDLQADVLEQISANERRSHFFGKQTGPGSND
jgi:hypothetical protein